MDEHDEIVDPRLLAEWFWVDRWMRSSGFLLPPEPRCLYREMLSQAWIRGARLPNDLLAIQRAVGFTAEEWARAWPQVERYWRVDGASLVNDTQLQVHAEALSRHLAHVRGGRARAAGAPREGGRFASKRPAGNQVAGDPLDQQPTSRRASTQPAGDQPPSPYPSPSLRETDVPVVFPPSSEDGRSTTGTTGTADGTAEHGRNGVAAAGVSAAREEDAELEVESTGSQAAQEGGVPSDLTSVAVLLRDLTAEDLPSRGLAEERARFEPFFYRLRRAGRAPLADRQEVSHFALALQCRAAEVKNPVALFIARVQEGDWSKLRPEYFAAAEVAYGRRAPDGEAEKRRLEEAAARELGSRLPKDLPPELRERLAAAAPRSREWQEATDAIVAWRREHEPGPRRFDPDVLGISAAAFLERVQGRSRADA